MYAKHHMDIGDWRRDNVNRFIRQFYETVHKTKPWVKVGISPFGIYRNRRNDLLRGSNTNGLQNYDDLYADVLLWVEKGWLDYCVPQIYWEIGHKQADYATLIRWWDAFAGDRPLFIGEDVERTVKYADPQNYRQTQQAAKHELHMRMMNVQGTVLWYAKAVVDDKGGYGTKLRNEYWRNPALMPRMPFIDKKAPNKPRKLTALWTNNDYVLFWTAPKGHGWKNRAAKYVVYRFAANEPININNPNNIVTITSNTFLKLPYVNGRREYTYVVTALDRMQNESKVAKKKVML